MLTRRLNPAGEPADLAAVMPVAVQYFAEATPGFPACGETRMRFWASDGYRSRTETYGVFADEGDAVALAVLQLGYDLDDNLDMARAVFALPAALRDGEVGALLGREALRLAAAEGRSRIVADSAATADPTAYFTGLGGRLVNTDTRSVLDLGTVDRARYEAWAAGSAKNAGYRLVRWIDHCPEEFADSFCEAMAAMDDAPQEDLVREHPKTTAERLRGREEHSARYGIRRHVQVAVDAAGTVAGFHMFVTVPDEPEVVEVWDTGVARDHRGHGLGLRMKAAATLWALEEHPRARWVQTFNNHGNAHMLNVNLAMGYRKRESWPSFEVPTGA